MGSSPFSFCLLSPKEDAQLRGANTDTLELLILLSLFSSFKTLQDGFTFCFGKLSGVHVGEGEQVLLLAPENGQSSVCN